MKKQRKTFILKERKIERQTKETTIHLILHFKFNYAFKVGT